MPHLPLDPSSHADGIRAYLAGALPQSQLTDAKVHGDYEPLLLLQTKHVMAAFAFSNGDLNKSYDTLYGYFKKFYTQERAHWDALDLAFVFCVGPDVPQLDRFCSHIETDVYFCRKFVIPLVEPLNQSLARLPFLPLSPLPGQSLRPPSAQTFLQQCGVPSVLAKYLVVQRERSAEGIVEDCSAGAFGQVRELTSGINKGVPHVELAGSPVRINSVSIKNFRAYRRLQTFRIGPDVTILYGPNGFGKTSFFDAVDFAVTGEIGRMGSSISEQHFRKTAKHLDSGSEDSTVSVSLHANGTIRKLTRKVGERKYAELDGRQTDRKTILTELTASEFPAADRIDNLVTLFRATHLFSQEHQEFAKDFQQDCELSEQIVSRLLAFEDYTNASNKVAKVRELIDKAIAKSETDIEELSQQVVDDQDELEQLSRTAREHTTVEALDHAIQVLRSRLTDVGIKTDSDKQDAEMIRGWRATVERQYQENQRKSERLSMLARETTRLTELRTRLTKLQPTMPVKEQAIADAQKGLAAAEQRVRDADRALADLIAKHQQAVTKEKLLQAIRNTKPVFTDLLSREMRLEQELSDARTMLLRSRDAEGKATSDLKAMEIRAGQLDRDLIERHAMLASIQELRKSFSGWQVNAARLVELTQTAEEARKLLEALNAEEARLAAELDSLSRDETRLTQHIAQVDSNQSALRRLLSQLQQHVENGTCPLCGQEHGSRDVLLQRIEAQVALDAASTARRELALLKEKVRSVSDRLQAQRGQLRRTETAEADGKTSRTQLSNDMRAFEGAIAAIGLSVEEPTKTFRELQDREEMLLSDISALEKATETLRVQLDSAREGVARAARAVKSALAEVDSKQSALGITQADLSRLRDDPRFEGVSLDIETESLAEMEKHSADDLAALDTDLPVARKTSEGAKERLTAAREEVNALQADLGRLRGDASELLKSITEISARLEQAGLASSVDEKQIMSLAAEEARRATQLLEIRDSAASLEVAIDAAATAAALSRLRQNIANKQKAAAAAKRTREQHLPWQKYFASVSGLLSAQQNEAISHFTSQYGPRTSVIQRRLRAVYGFDDVEIQSHESAIRVRVRRRGEELKPTDYFSQSQQQTLLLGLFLTACLSQTWSALSPIFLDDPVTHFDDLNTYAFLDLIVGLLESDVGRRQFIISTCDEKFLQLARQKFRHLGDRAKYYSFVAIGTDGPVIEEMTVPGSIPSNGNSVN